MTDQTQAQYGLPAYVADDRVDLFGRSLVPVPMVPLRSEAFWSCFGCSGFVPDDIEPDIAIVFARGVVLFCSDDCAEETPGFARAVELHRARYAAIGQYRIALVGEMRTPGGPQAGAALDGLDESALLIRLVDPHSPSDRALFANVIEIEYERPEVLLMGLAGDGKRP